MEGPLGYSGSSKLGIKGGGGGGDQPKGALQIMPASLSSVMSGGRIILR